MVPEESSAPVAAPGGRRSTRHGRARLALVVALAVLAADQATKLLAEARLPGRTVDVVPGVLDLVLVRNPGAAFSLGTSFTVVLSLLAAVVVVAVAVLARRTTSRPWLVVLGLVAGGAGGNLVDRLLRDPGPLRGEVVDFLRLPSWPVFNLADTALTTAAALGVWLSVRDVPLSAGTTPEPSEPPTGDEAHPRG